MEGDLKFFLGLQIRQTNEGIFVNQSKFTKELVSKFGFYETKIFNTSMSTTDKITKNLNGKSVDTKIYRNMIGSLLYLSTSRLDISYSIGACVRYQADPKESHLKVVKRIIRYINSTINHGLWYSFDTNNIVIVGYSDANRAGNVDDRKNTSGKCLYIENCLISWHNKKHNSISLSISEVNYITTRSGCTQLLWMKQILKDYGICQDTMNLFIDNLSTIQISKNPVQHSRTKHIGIRHHFIRDLVEEKVASL